MFTCGRKTRLRPAGELPCDVAVPQRLCRHRQVAASPWRYAKQSLSISMATLFDLTTVALSELVTEIAGRPAATGPGLAVPRRPEPSGDRWPTTATGAPALTRMSQGPSSECSKEPARAPTRPREGVGPTPPTRHTPTPTRRGLLQTYNPSAIGSCCTRTTTAQAKLDAGYAPRGSSSGRSSWRTGRPGLPVRSTASPNHPSDQDKMPDAAVIA